MPIRTSAAAHTEAMVRIGLDPSGLEVNAEKAKAYWESLTNKIQTTSPKVVSSAQGIGKAFESMPRGSAFNLINTQLASITYQMMGTSRAGLALGSAFGIVERAMMAMGTGMWMTLGIMAAITAAVALLNLTTEKGSKAFKEYRKKIEEWRKETERAIKEVRDFAENNLRFNKALYVVISTFLGTKVAIQYATNATIKWRNEYEAFIASSDEVNRTLEEQVSYLKTLAASLGYATKSASELRKEEEERIKRAAALYRGPEMLPGFGVKKEKSLAEQLTFGTGGTTKFITDSAQTMIEVGNVMIKSSAESAEAAARAMLAKQEATRAAWQSYASQIGNAFASAFMGVEGAWSNLINNMINRFLSAGFEAMIMSILFPGADGFAGFFKKALGFQYGTSYVPRTGMYALHRGEAVIPASQNISNIRNYNTGGNIQNIYLLNLDTEKLTRRQIVPLIEQMSKNRQTRILTI